MRNRMQKTAALLPSNLWEKIRLEKRHQITVFYYFTQRFIFHWNQWKLKGKKIYSVLNTFVHYDLITVKGKHEEKKLSESQVSSFAKLARIDYLRNISWSQDPPRNPQLKLQLIFLHIMQHCLPSSLVERRTRPGSTKPPDRGRARRHKFQNTGSWAGVGFPFY